MSAVRSKHNAAEVLLRKELWRRGFRYRLHKQGLFGRPDLVFASARVVVFVDGDYWHARALREEGEPALRATLRTSRQDWWVEKLKKNMKRDIAVNDALKSIGWRVIRVWESEINADLARAADRVSRALTGHTLNS